MKDIKPKSIKSAAVSGAGAKRKSITMEEGLDEKIEISASEKKDRIEQNPFFERKPKAISNQRTKVTHDSVASHGSVSGQMKASRTPFVALWGVAAVLVLGVGFAVANYFSSATVDITPVMRKATIKSDFRATKEGGDTDLVFKFMSLTEEKAKEIPTTIEKKIQKKASGKVFIYNAYNGEKQRLIKNTRLESSDHKIFRIDESVVVPGASIVAGKVVEPGSVLATIYADVPGKDYNIGLSDFTVPGFKGDPRYTKFSARSKPDSPIIGGFSGTVNVPSEESVLVAQEELKQDLKKSSIEKARAQIPDGATFFPGSIVLKFEEVPQDFATGDTVRVSMRAIVSVFFFDTETIIRKLAEASLPEYQGNIFVIPKISTLTFSFVDPIDNVVLSDLTKIHFSVAGEAVFVGKIDEKKIRSTLAGKEKKDFGKIIVGERNVGKAEAVIRPMWKTVFPSNEEKIKIDVISN